MKRYFCRIMMIGLLGWFAVAGGQVLAAGTLSLDAPPSAVSIGTTYNGSILAVSGRVTAKDEVVIRFVGTPRDLHLKRKGKAFGLLWMNMDSVTFSNAPSVCIIGSAKPIPQLAADGTIAAGADRAASLGLDGLANQMEVEPEAVDKATLFRELLKMKQEEGLYSELGGIVQYGTTESGMKSFTARIPLPSRLSPGSYRLEAYVVAEGLVVFEKTYPVQASLTGMPHIMYSMAINHSLLYGLLATIVAILGGLLMAVLFGGSKGAH